MPSYQTEEEVSTLLAATPTTPEERPNASSSPHKLVGMAIAATALLVGVAGVRHATGSTSAAPAAADMSEYGDWNMVNVSKDVHQSTAGWYFYKSAVIARNGSTDRVADFMARHTGGHTCASVNLGCDGYKITCTYGTASESDDSMTADYWDRQLHYVHAPKLYSHAVDGDGLGADGWMDFQEESYKSMKEFNAFMHNKFVLFTHNIEAKAMELKNENWPTMKRLSVYKEGGYAAHILVSLEGYVWEFVGFAPESCASGGESDDCEYQMWSEDECPAAHSIDANMTALTKMITKGTDNLESGQQWGDGYANSTIWITNSIASSGLSTDEMELNFALLKERTQAQIKYSGESTESPTCNVATISYNNLNTELSGEADHVTLKYVHNWKHQSATSPVTGKTLSIADFENYIGRVHSKYLMRPHSKDPDDMWRNWDHWLDMHIGIKWYETTGNECYNHNQDITSMLKDNHIMCGKRATDTDGDHFYTGTPQSTMCLEFNTECNYGAKGETNVCTCNKENSNELAFFMGQTDQTGSIDDDSYGCHHDDEF